MLRSILPFFVTAALGAVHTVEVGESGLVFEPQTLTAVPGDIVVFELYPSHNVVQGNYGSPCQSNDNGFYSGPFSNTNNGAKRFVINVTSNDPVYYYCSVQKHCENGMVGGINVPTSGQTIDAYKQAAASVQQSQTPSQLRGGQLLDESQVAALGGNATSSSASAS
ncbi:hypothetical protein E8E13_009594 [Curvularia kusanoi]|uniref:Blue (type 1) copper domain-containing protein n=1 Tax=Curvularia kusanoi TaxID=90978 RepID=A0A9P4TJA9_CURKU|nr:hypothetical protein E8E13_009594 [Curvularia kusanoi]